MKLPPILHRRRRVLIFRLVANGASQAAATMALAFLVRTAFARLNGGGSYDLSLPLILTILAVVIGAGMVLRIAEQVDAARLGEDYVTQVRLRLFDAVSSEPALTMERRGLGPTMLRFVTDLTAVRQWVTLGLAKLVVATLGTVGGIVALVVVDTTMGLTVAVIAAIGLLAAMALRSPLAARARINRRERARLASRIGDRLRAIGVVQLSGQVNRERRALGNLSRTLADTAVSRARSRSFLRVVPDAVLGLSTLAILAIGAMSSGNPAEHGVIIAALSVLGTISPQVRALGRVFEYRVNYKVAARKLNEILGGTKRRSQLNENSEATGDAEGRLDFESLSVKGTLVDINSSVAPGTLVAVVGPSGSGKSSLLAAAARLLKPSGGRVLLDGKDLTRLDGRTLARNIAMVSRDFPLLKGSLRRNLTYRFGKASDTEIDEACRLSGLDLDMVDLTQGLQTRVTEEQARLASGLRQRLCLARAVLGRPAVLLLDDPDAASDPRSREAIDRILRELPATVLLATHDLARVRQADLMWYLEGGCLTEAGPPAEVLSQHGPAARFFNLTDTGRENSPANVTPLIAATENREDPLSDYHADVLANH